MTTKAAAHLYEAQHLLEMEGRKVAFFNPLNRPIADLPVVYGFNNGGSPGMMDAVLLAEDGTCLGGHLCSSEGYMPHDLGILEGTREDRHEEFRKHYPDGYRMEFVRFENAREHEGLNVAFKRYQVLAEKSEKEEL